MKIGLIKFVPDMLLKAVLFVLTCSLLVACMQPQATQQALGEGQENQLTSEDANATAALSPTVEQQMSQLAGHISAMSRMLQTVGTEMTEIKAQQIIQERDTARINGIADSLGLLHRKVDYVEKKIRAMEDIIHSKTEAQKMYYGEGDVSNLEQEMEAALLSPERIEFAPKTSPLESTLQANNLAVQPPVESSSKSAHGAAHNRNGFNVDALLALGDDRPALHIASLRDLSRVEQAWNELRQTYPRQLSDLDWRLSVVDLPDQGRYYRMKAGPLKNFEQAQGRCDELKLQKKYCKVVDFTGTKP